MHADNDRGKMLSRRVVALGLGKIVLVTALIGRMYYLQVLQAARYRLLSDENRFNTRLLAPTRGRILDRFGVPMAINTQNFQVQIVSEQADSVEATLEALGHIIPLNDHDRNRIRRDAERRRSFVPVTVRENLSWVEMARIQVNAPDLPGVLIDQGLTRHYPLKELGAHVLGYVAAVAEDDLTGDRVLELPGFRVGRAGVERVHDLALRGKGGTYTVEVNAVGRVMKEVDRREGEPGQDIRLALDIRLQQFAAERLGEDSAAVVAMDIYSGEIVLMASHPSFDPNAFTRGLSNHEWRDLTTNPRSPLTNKCIAGQYAPGSTFKLVTALAALEANAITPDVRVFCPGHTSLGNTKFHCWKKGGHGSVDLFSGIAHSCDVYFYEVARRVGIDRIAEMSRKLGLGARTGIDLPNERPGLIPDRKWKQATMKDIWHPGETLVAGIGQGFITTTPLQLCTMMARIANGGLKVDPRMSVTPQPVAIDKMQSLGIAKNNIAMVRKGMFGVSNVPGGTAYVSRLDFNGMALSGKTGTSQVRRISRAERDTGVKKNEDLPWEQRDHALFVAYAPEHEPRYAIAVVVEHGGSGSKAAAPIARDVMREILRHDPVKGIAAPVAADDRRLLG